MTPAIAAKTYAAAANSAMPNPASPARADPTQGFAEMLGSAMSGLVESGKAADQASMAGIAGKTDPVSVVTAVAETELALETVVSIRDRVISAYEDILRMPI